MVKKFGVGTGRVVVSSPFFLGFASDGVTSLVMSYLDPLLQQLDKAGSSMDRDAVKRAYDLAVQAHEGQIRQSGEPYVTHPVAVAGILADLRLDLASIITALLHDTVEDTNISHDDVRLAFGPEIADLVNGVTKLTQLELSSESTKQAENFRKLLLAISKDIRVLLVKLADRVHNMRTLGALGGEKKRRIALETMEIYAPLAGLIGMQHIRDELEDLSFEILSPEARTSVIMRLRSQTVASDELINRIAGQIKTLLAEHRITATVYGREKRAYSIWRKMERKAISFEQLSDIYGFRVLVETPDDCYRALGIIHQKWSTVPERFKDYISTPKRNDYRSIHTTVVGPQSQRVELQIRTHEMEGVAEQGIAAHWKYKTGDGGTFDWRPDVDESRSTFRLREMIETLEQGATPQELLDNTKLELFQDQVFCFTPKGRLIALPRGATPVDFAYAVHTDIGNRCVGAKIHGRVSPLKTTLQNGDIIEVLTSNVEKPNPDWEKFVVTGKARYTIRRFVRAKEKAEFAQLGFSLAERAFAEHGQKFSKKAVREALKRLDIATEEDVYERLGRGSLHWRKLLEAVFPGLEIDSEPEALPRAKKKAPKKRTQKKSKKGARAVPIHGLVPGAPVQLGTCCHPIPGDRIVGIIETGKGVGVHTIDCELLRTFQDAPETWLDLSWDDPSAADMVPVGRLQLQVLNQRGTLGTLSTVIADNGANISNVKIGDRGRILYELTIDVEVEDLKHLTQIMAALRASEPVQSVERVRGDQTNRDEN